MTMINCVDQMCATTRGKIQEIRADYPGRHIVLLGFNTGATLALQLAQVEPVMCVVCLGFSLLTAEGKRGEPDDTLLELQCPVLFVIGQCSNTSLQEDMEDLRERMRVETGLIVVGSADDYLRVNKKKKKAEGITQSVVDRCVVDEVGEFVSGVILSPYPPQIRQSPTHASADSANKKSKERKRFNSNASSLDSEPPSPTPRITRPGFNKASVNLGRPPGSKSKSKLEAKWAAQIAQGTSHTPSPSSTPPPLHTPNTPDTSSNDSSLTEKQPVPKKVLHSEPPTKKIKTLKPVLASPEKALKTVTANATQLKGQTLATAKLQAYGFNRSVMTGGTLSTLLQGGIKTIPPTQPRSSASGIKVLENVTLNSGTTAKIISNTGRAIDLSKITVFNSMNTGKSTVNALGNVVLLPDGKIKSVHGPPIKGAVNAPMLVPMSSPTKILQPGTSYPTHVPRGSRGKYITSKRQLIGNKPPRPTKKINYMPPTIQATLPPPTNLTTQDIMDLPIIFADDNQLIDNTLTSEIITSLPTPQIAPPPKIIPSTPGSKFVLVNKQIPGQGNFIISPSNIKKPAMVSLSKAPPKYTKIILSKRSPAEELKASASNIRISNLSPEISVKKVPIQEQPSLSTTNLAPLEEPIDLENELVATAVPKPNYATSDVKNITIITKKNPEILKSSDIFQMKPHSISHQEVSQKLVNESVVDSDPDYIPPKTMKLDSAQS